MSVVKTCVNLALAANNENIRARKRVFKLSHGLVETRRPETASHDQHDGTGSVKAHEFKSARALPLVKALPDWSAAFYCLFAVRGRLEGGKHLVGVQRAYFVGQSESHIAFVQYAADFKPFGGNHHGKRHVTAL